MLQFGRIIGTSIYPGFPAGQCINGEMLSAVGYEANGNSEELFHVALSGECGRTSWSKQTHKRTCLEENLTGDANRQKCSCDTEGDLREAWFKTATSVCS